MSNHAQTGDVNRAIRRRALFACAVAVVLLPFAVNGALRALSHMSNDVLSWTATDLEAKRRFEWFDEHFEGQELIFVSWDGCAVDDPRLDGFASGLRSLTTDPQAGRSFIQSVTTSADVFRDLTSPPASFSAATALAKLRGVLIGPDGRTGCAIVVLTSDAQERGTEAIAQIHEAAEAVPKLGAEALKLAGYPVQMAAVDAASLDTLYTLAIPAAVVVLFTAWVFLRSILLTLAVGAMAGICQAASMSLVYYLDSPMSGMISIMPVLVFVLFVSGAVHLINYYGDAAREVGHLRAPAAALAAGGYPCFLAVVTSALGIASLTVSRIVPVNAFGRMTSLGMIITVSALLTMLPGALVVLARRQSRVDDPAPRLPLASSSPTWIGVNWFVQRYRWAIQWGALIVVVFCAVGLRHVQTSMKLTDFFDAPSRIVQDYRWLESNLGPLFPAEVVLEFDDVAPDRMYDRLEYVTNVEAAIRRDSPQSITISAATFAIRPETTSGLRSTLRKAVTARKLRQHRANLLKNRYLGEVDGSEYWRITVRYPSIDGRPFHDTRDQLKSTVATALVKLESQTTDAAEPIFTGLLPLVADAQAELLRGLVLSFVTSVFLIGGALVVGLKSLRFGIFSTVPNFFPLVLVFGALGWTSKPIDVGTMMTASIGLGIAVDDTVHFLTWFKRSIDAGLSSAAAVRTAFLRCGAAIVRTTLICGAGLILFTLSDFAPAAQFGRTICLLLAAALVGDLLLLPALLLGPLGRYVADSSHRPSTHESAALPVAEAVHQ